MPRIYKAVAKLAALCALLFGGSIVIYLFNLDMRLIARLQPLIAPIYDRVERAPMP